MKDNKNKNLSAIKRIHLFFIIAGFLEVFCFVSLTHIIYLGIVGAITIIPSYLSRESSGLKYNLFPSIWAILKYNPFGIALLIFAINDLSFNLFDTTLYIIYGIVMLLLAISSFVLGIILLVKRSRLMAEKRQV